SVYSRWQPAPPPLALPHAQLGCAAPMSQHTPGWSEQAQNFATLGSRWPQSRGGHLVGVAQSVERRVVVADVAGSSPVVHPRCARCELSTVGPVEVRTSLSFRAPSAQA